MDVKNMSMYARCGGISRVGTSNGKLRNVGSSAVNVGMDRIRFELCGWNSVVVSLVFSIMIIAVRNIIHSIAMFVGLRMFRPVP